MARSSLHGITLDVGTRLERALVDALGRIWTHGGGVDLDAWMRTVEATTCRTALLTIGEVAVARLLLAVSGGPAAGLSAADRMRGKNARAVRSCMLGWEYALLHKAPWPPQTKTF